MFHRRRPRPTTAPVSNEVVANARRAFDVITSARRTGHPTRARGWMTAECAEHWAANSADVASRPWAQRDVRVIDAAVVSQTTGERDAAWVRFVLAPQDAQSSDRWIEHWSVVRAHGSDASNVCTSCGRYGQVIGDRCPRCGAQADAVAPAWVVDSILARPMDGPPLPGRRLSLPVAP